jgi:hypothetical protein
MAHPKHTREELAVKLRQIYPEIDAHGIALSLEFNHEKDAWIVHFRKGAHELTTHLERKDADGCMEGIQCIYLGVQIAQLIKNFEGGA